MKRGSAFDAVILAGGKGTRLKGVISDRPKPMAEVAGRPFLEWQLMFLRSLGITRAVICTGYKAESVENYFNSLSGLGMDVVYSREDSPRGTGGAVLNALPLVQTDPFLVLNGDSLCPFDPSLLLKTYEGSGASVILLLVEVPEAGRFGTVILDGNGYIKDFREKKPSGESRLINAGVYLMGRSLLEKSDEAGFFSLETDIFPQLPPRAMAGLVGHGPFLDIGTPESYREATRFISERFPLTDLLDREDAL